MESLKIKSGNAMVYYCFDVANEIDIDHIESIFGKKPEKRGLIAERLTPRYVQYSKPPLLVRLGKKKIGKLSFDLEAKIYDFGVVTIRFWTPINGELKDLKEISSRLIENKTLEDLSRKELGRIKEEIKAATAFHKMDVEEFYEDYLIFEVNKFDRKITPEELLENYKMEIAKTLRCENRLSTHELLDAVKFHLSYYRDDIVFIDWNAAFIFDEKHTYDVHDVLEYAVIELLELRTYDTVLDKVLEKAYDDMGKKQGLSLYPHSKTMNYLATVKLEISDVIEKVENSLKLVGDPYLAKVYTVASNRFYHDKWRNGVEKKLDTVESIYSTLSGRTWDRRLLFVEIFMTLLFVIWFIMELIILFASGK